MELKNRVALRAQLAILSIFRELGIPSGDVLSIGEIQRAWPTYAVRASDLAPALKALIDDKRLALEPGSQDVLTLTVLGERWMRRQPASLKHRLLVSRIAQQSRRHRAGPAGTPLPRRRRTDPVPRSKAAEPAG